MIGIDKIIWLHYLIDKELEMPESCSSFQINKKQLIKYKYQIVPSSLIEKNRSIPSGS